MSLQAHTHIKGKTKIFLLGSSWKYITKYINYCLFEQVVQNSKCQKEKKNYTPKVPIRKYLAQETTSTYVVPDKDIRVNWSIIVLVR